MSIEDAIMGGIVFKGKKDKPKEDGKVKTKAIRFSTLESICEVLHCQPGDILEYVEDSKEEKNN